MGKMFCPDCQIWRHVAEVGSDEVIHKTGQKPTRDCCWFCGHPEGSTPEKPRAWIRPEEPVITEAMIDAGLKAQADAVTTYTLPDLSKGPTERIKRLTMADILRAGLRAAE